MARHNEVYEPREDSRLLEKSVKANAFGLVLDMGTGSGIQAIAAAKSPLVSGVVAADVNPLALEKARENARNQGVEKKIKFIESDLFSALGERKFDAIAFNPPYLPSTGTKEKDDVALESGVDGREATERFLASFEKHIKPGGIVLLLQSTASDWEKTRLELEHKGFSVEIAGREKFFFEEIVVLKATRVLR